MGNGSSIKINIPRLKMKVRGNPEEENTGDGYDSISSLQSLKHRNQIKMYKCDFRSDVASDEDRGFSSLTAVPNCQISSVLDPKLAEKCSQFSSLAMLANKHSHMLGLKTSENCSHFSSLAHFAKKHLSAALKPQQPSEKSSHFSLPARFANEHSSSVHDLSSEGSNFSSLAQLANKHNKVFKQQTSVDDNGVSSLADLANRHLKSKIQAEKHILTLSELASQCQQVQREDCVSSLVGPFSQQLKIHKDLKTSDRKHVKEFRKLEKVQSVSCSSNEYVDLNKCPVFSPGNRNSVSIGQESMLPVVQRFDNLATDLHISKTESEMEVSEIMGEVVRDCEMPLDTSLNATPVEHSSVIRTPSEEDIETDWEIDLTPALISPGSRSSQLSANSEPKIVDWKLEDVEQEVLIDIVPLETLELIYFDASSKILNQKLPGHKKRSQFGSILCRKWKQLPTPCIAPRKQSLNGIICFSFNTDSPDDTVSKHGIRKWNIRRTSVYERKCH
jgi:hypothetical protein